MKITPSTTKYRPLKWKWNRPGTSAWNTDDAVGTAEYEGLVLRVSISPDGKWYWSIEAPDGRVLTNGIRVSREAAMNWARGVSRNELKLLSTMARSDGRLRRK
jgi:hypothetical protein